MGEALGVVPFENYNVGLEFPSVVEVLPCGNSVASEVDQLCTEGGVVSNEGAGQAPIARGHERHPLTLAFYDHADRDALYATGAELRHDLFPEDRRNLVAVQPVENPAGLLGINQATVEFSRLLDGLFDRLLCDLVEHHALDRNTRVENLEEMPRDCLAFAILVRRQIELVGILEQSLEMPNLHLGSSGHDVEGLEIILSVDAQPRPLFRLVGRRHLRSTAREVADVPNGGLDNVVVPEEARDCAGLGWRFDDYEGFGHNCLSFSGARQ